MDNCLFCSIINGAIPSTKVYENDHVYAFEDIAPQASVHILVISKKHVANILEASDQLSYEELAACFKACADIAKMRGLDQSGFRLATNCGKDACQSVEHFHIHILGGNPLSPSMV